MCRCCCRLFRTPRIEEVDGGGGEALSFNWVRQGCEGCLVLRNMRRGEEIHLFPELCQHVVSIDSFAITWAEI